MSYLQRIEDLETAVLHLTRAVNSLLGAIQAVKAEGNIRSGESSPLGLAGPKTSDDLVRDANKYLKEAFEVVAE